jgi:hypothetical protein
MVIVEKFVEWRLVGETEVLGENMPQRHFVHHKSHMPRPGFEKALTFFAPSNTGIMVGPVEPGTSGSVAGNSDH